MRGPWVLLGRMVHLSLPGRARWAPLTLRRVILLSPLVLVFLALQMVHWVGFALDEILFRGYRRVRLRDPLFVVGMPRSGTSYLQSVLARDPRFTTMRLWELLLAPSVTERKLWMALGALDRAVGRPVGRSIRALQGKSLKWMEDVHPVSLFEPEEDHLLLLPVFACFLLVVPFPEHPAVWDLTRFDEWPRRDREAILDFYESCLKRHLYTVGPEKRVLSKNPSFTPFALSLAERFPASRFVLCVRDPRKAVPSLLSSLDEGARFFGHDIRRPDTRDRLVEMMASFGERLDTVSRALPEDRWAYAPLRDVRGDLGRTVGKIYGRFGWEPDPGFRAILEVQAPRASGYRSGHMYTAEDYGLSIAEIERRFEPLIRRFGFDTTATRGAGGSA